MLTREFISAANPRAILLAFVLVSSALLVAPAGAGTQDNPEAADPAGDQIVTAGPLAQSPPTFDNIDVVGLWIYENATNSSMLFNVETSAPFNDASIEGSLAFQFTIGAGPTSRFGSTANGTAFNVIARADGTMEGIENATVTFAQNVTMVEIPMASLGAVGGDLLNDLALDAIGLHRGSVPDASPAPAFDADDSSATDRVPDTDFVPAYTFARPPVVAGVGLAVQGALARTVTDPAATVVYTLEVTNRGTDEDRFTFTPPTPSGATASLAPSEVTLAPGTSTLTFLSVELTSASIGSVLNLPVTVVSERGASATATPSLTLRAIGAEIELRHAGAAERTTQDPFASLAYTIEVHNLGTDFDTITFATPTVTGAATATISPSIVSLASGAKSTATLTIRLDNATSAVTVVLAATSDHGANATLTSKLLPDVAGAAGTEGAKAGLGFLTPAAEALGFDDLFGEWAEVALLGIGLLVLLIGLFLILFLPKRPWLEIEVHPRTLSAAPGETAEFQVQVRNRKKDFHRAVARLSGEDADWKAGLLLRQEDGGSLEPMTGYGDLVFGLTAREEPGDHYEGTLRVQVPESAAPKARSKVDLEIIPLDEGDERPRKGGRARISVKAVQPPTGEQPIAISDVEHEPERPEEGELVRTTAHIANVSDEPWRLDACLLLDDRTVAEQRLELAPGEERHLLFEWRAGAGSNKVRLQVLEAKE